MELQEALAESRAELDRLHAIAADREAQNVQLREALAEVRAAAGQQSAENEALRAQIEALQSEVASLREGLTAAQDQARSTATKYRDAILAVAPEVPADLVRGDSIEEIEASLAQARQIVSRLREHLEAQTPAPVPAGAPPRTRQEFSDLSPQEKIALGLRRGT
jgi:DNA repair exonuclease SbcCD ATPase subunit